MIVVGRAFEVYSTSLSNGFDLGDMNFPANKEPKSEEVKRN